MQSRAAVMTAVEVMVAPATASISAVWAFMMAAFKVSMAAPQMSWVSSAPSIC